MKRIVLLVSALAMACGGSSNTGLVTGVDLSDGQTVAVVTMDDGREVRAVMPESDGVTEFVGGQRVQLEPIPDSPFWRVVGTLESEERVGRSGSTEPFDVALLGKTRQQQWNPPDRAPGVVVARGVALKMIDFEFSGFEAEAGYEIVVVDLEIAINAEDVTLPMDKAVALDAAGNEYPNLADAKPVGKGTGQRRQFGFAVPTDTELVTLRLSNGFTLDLSGT